MRLLRRRTGRTGGVGFRMRSPQRGRPALVAIELLDWCQPVVCERTTCCISGRIARVQRCVTGAVSQRLMRLTFSRKPPGFSLRRNSGMIVAKMGVRDCAERCRDCLCGCTNSTARSSKANHKRWLASWWTSSHCRYHTAKRTVVTSCAHGPPQADINSQRVLASSRSCARDGAACMALTERWTAWSTCSPRSCWRCALLVDAGSGE